MAINWGQSLGGGTSAPVTGRINWGSALAASPQAPAPSKLDQQVINSFQNIDPERRAVVLDTFAQKAKAGDKDAARKLQLLTPHVDAPAPAAPDYGPKDFGSKLGAAVYGAGQAVVDSAVKTGKTIATLPHALNAAGISLASMAEHQTGEQLAKSKQKALDEINKTPFAPNFAKTVAETKSIPATKALAGIGGTTLENVLNVATLGEGSAATQGAKAIIKGGAGAITKTAAKGAATGAAYGVAGAGQNNVTDPGELAKTVRDSAITGALLGVGVPAAGRIVGKTAAAVAKRIGKFNDDPVYTVAADRVLTPTGASKSGRPFSSKIEAQQAINAEIAKIKADPNQLRAIDEQYTKGGWKSLTGDTGKPPEPGIAVPVTGRSRRTDISVTKPLTPQEQAIASSDHGQNLSSRSAHFDESLQTSIKGIENSGGYQKLLAEKGGDKVITNEAVLNAAKQAGPLDHETIIAAKPLDKIDTLTLVRAKATVDDAAKQFTDAWQGGKHTDAELTKMSKHMSALEAGYKIMSAEPGRATQIQSTFIDEAFKRGQKLRELIESTKGATPEIRSQRIAQDLAAFDQMVAKAKQSGVFSKEVFTKIHNIVSEYATAAKLTSPLTHVKNMASNLATLVQRGAENVFTMSWGALKGETTLEQARHIFGSSQALQNASEQFVKDFKQAWNPNAKDLASGLDKQEIKPAIPGKVGKAIRTPFNLLAAGDNFFKTMLRDSEYHQSAFGKAYQEGFRGLALDARVKELVKSPTPEMTAKAEKAALEFTFQDDPGVIANGFSHILGKLPLLRLLVPFVKTPTNVVKFQYQRSPMGVFSKRNIQDIMSGGIERREAVARLTIGTGMSVGAAMAVMNMGDNITGAAPTNQGEKDNFYAATKKPYSVLIAGKWWAYNSISPLGMYLTQAVALRDALTNGNSKTAGNIFSSMGVTMAKGVVDLPFVSGVSNVIAALNNPSNQSLASKAFGQIITGLIPNAMRDVANATDSTQRQANSITDQVKMMIPGPQGRQSLPARQTVFGTEQVDTRTGLERGLLKITSNDQSTKLTKALDEIGKQTGYYPQPPSAKNKVNGKALTPDQFTKYQVTAGSLFTSKLEKALNDANFQDLSADDKKRTVEKMITDSRTKAGDEVIGKQGHNPKHKVKGY